MESGTCNELISAEGGVLTEHLSAETGFAVAEARSLEICVGPLTWRAHSSWLGLRLQGGERGYTISTSGNYVQISDSVPTNIGVIPNRPLLKHR